MRVEETILKAVTGRSGSATRRLRLRFGIRGLDIATSAGITVNALKKFEAGASVPAATSAAIGQAMRTAIVDSCLEIAFLLGGDSDPRLRALRVVRSRARQREPGGPLACDGVIVIDTETDERFVRP